MPLAETQVLIETQPLSLEGQTHGSFTFNLIDQQQAASPRKTLPAVASLPPSNLAMELESPMSSAPPSPIAEYSNSEFSQRQKSIEKDTEMLSVSIQRGLRLNFFV